MRVALRCDRHLHAIFDTERQVFEIKCERCTKREKHPVFHNWHVKGRVIRGADVDDEGLADCDWFAAGERIA